jgi:hypothetical protein
MVRNALFVLAVASAALGCKGDRNKCETACRNFYTLTYWEKADALIAAAPEGARENMKKTKLAQFTSALEDGVDLCVNQCSSANNDEQVDCMTNAKTSVDAKKCSAKDD